MRHLLRARLLVTLIALVVVDLQPATRNPSHATGHLHLVTRNMERDAQPALPADLAPVVIQTLQAASGASYRVVERPSSTAGAASFEAPNAAHAFTTQFDADGLTIKADEGSRASRRPLRLRLAEYGSSANLQPIRMQPWAADGLRVERTSANPARPLVEWYVNGRLGLEQGFTVSHRLMRRRTLSCSRSPSATDGRLARSTRTRLRSSRSTAPHICAMGIWRSSMRLAKHCLHRWRPTRKPSFSMWRRRAAQRSNAKFRVFVTSCF